MKLCRRAIARCLSGDFGKRLLRTRCGAGSGSTSGKRELQPTRHLKLRASSLLVEVVQIRAIPSSTEPERDRHWRPTPVGRYDAPEALGLDTALRGLSMTGTDEQTLAVSDALFAGLYEF